MENFSTIHQPAELLPDIDASGAKEKILGLYSKLKAKFEALGSYKIDPATEQEIGSLQEEAAAVVESVYHKISQQLGSNEGGWYENSATQEKFYIKFYKNPDQARIEYIANAIYKKLGIKAVESTLMEMDGKLSIASREVANNQSSYREEQAQNSDVRSGFIADAYLANWDVVGLVFDNIVKDTDGQMYRIDNGGSLTFRAQGQPKDFLPNDIPELKSMLNLDFPAGQVFAGLTQEELKIQAKNLVSSLSVGDIEEIIRQSGLDEEQAKNIQASLVSRRSFLISEFGLEQRSNDRIPIAIEKLKEQLEQLKNLGLRPRVGILADANKIENQEIDIIDATDIGRYEINFKLTAEHWGTIVKSLLPKKEINSYAETDENAIYYTKATDSKSKTKTYDESGDESGDQDDNRVRMSDAFIIEKDGIKIRISSADQYNHRSFLGVVHIEVPSEGGLSSEEIGERINYILEEVLQIPGGLSMPTPEAESKYKRARYAWHHKLSESDATPEDLDSKLVRQEVFPGYFTFTQEGKYKEYQQLSPYTTYHSLRSLETLPKIVGAGGLISTHERYRRGLMFEGMSSQSDLDGGGADSVFVRTATLEGLKTRAAEERYFDDTVAIIFNPRILDRTDWYAYSEDQYGKTSSEHFRDRQSPEKLFNEQKSHGFKDSNEQMFRCGISLNDFLAITSKEIGKMVQIGQTLRTTGIKTINGRPIEEMIFLIHTYKDALDISNGNTEGLVTLAKFTQENPDRVLEIEWQSVANFTENLARRAHTWTSFNLMILEDDTSNWDFPNADSIENELFDYAESLLKDGLYEYIKSSYSYIGNDIDVSKIPEKLRADLTEKFELLLKNMTEFLETIRTKKDDLQFGHNFDVYEKRVSEIKTGIIPIIESLKDSK